MVEIKTREHEVIKDRRKKIKRDALDRWIAASRRVSDAKELMLSFIQVRTEGECDPFPRLHLHASHALLHPGTTSARAEAERGKEENRR